MTVDTSESPPNLARVLEVRPEVIGTMAEPPGWLDEALRSVPEWRRRDFPFYIPVTADGLICRPVVEWARAFRSRHTASSYASDVAAFFCFLGPGVDWLMLDREGINSYIEWRLYATPVRRHGGVQLGVDPRTMARNLTALRGLYDVAVGMKLVAGNPVPPGVINATRGQLRSDANWLTRRAYQRWRYEGLLGLGAEREDLLVMRERNAAFADLLYHTGMRRAEGAGLLTLEIPSAKFTPHLVRGRVPASLAKGSPQRGRIFYLDRRVLQTLETYISGAREVEVAFGKASGIYEHDPDPLIIKRMERLGGIVSRVLVERPAKGESGWRSLDKLTRAERTRSYALDAHGARNPLALWLAHGGLPLSDQAWNGIFRAASRRTAKDPGFIPENGLLIEDDTRINVHPHMLRHSFALYVFALGARMELGGGFTRRTFNRLVREQNIWLRVQNLLGHASLETTRTHYLAPVLALEWEWFLTAANDAPMVIDEALSALSAGDDRVIDAAGVDVAHGDY
ncbi:hypothetical protein FEF26_12695 [Nesterenkonia salmonea]|uniref:Core-binding (CB) domain-containing protein n=1 Tax=Nesterenkonia salmonea TaxID=1804987 RepID=A0A5R9BAL5_9MICC|nr:site-specific integrase [Nesterenkonia salmonea]TLP93885.1 hypothetical protein FEF26_12695 [Nesterenkonia salmonea]